MTRIEFKKVVAIVLEEKDKKFLDCMCGQSAQFIICNFAKTEEIDRFLRPYIMDGNMETGIIKYLK